MFAIILAIIGAFFPGGFGGALLGYAIGWVIDTIRLSVQESKNEQRYKSAKQSQKYYNNTSEFQDNILELIAFVAISDNNRLRQSELDYCKQFFQKQFPHSDTSKLLLQFRDLLDSTEIASIASIACSKINKYATIHEKIAILQSLFGFVMADGDANQLEIQAIQDISDLCGIDRSTYEAIKMMYVGFSSRYRYSTSGNQYQGRYRQQYNDYEFDYSPSLDDYYKILEISSDSTDDEVKKAYRAAAIKHHPDKVSHLGEDVRKQAEEKFAKINEAYDKIKAARGMK